MKSIKNLVKTVEKLRSPKGCPWDKEQTHKTLKRYLIEEAYEAIDAIDKNNLQALKEELGDILLQVVLHSQIAKENKKFSFDDVAAYINKKMISRHPHVFGKTVVKNTQEVLANWESYKKKEKPYRKEILDGIPLSLPALLKALKVSKKVAKEGFDWKNSNNLWNTFEAELKEFEEALKSKNKNKQIEEFGDLLFMITNIARWYKIDPEDTLNKGIKKFIARYNKVKKLPRSKKRIKDLSSKELDTLWRKAKNNSR
ncbi:MAG: nucleoside triphosphate pyrophosphohydrolase [Candidatus Melainabacteria bacterium]|nr:nucleoside triphosphate pyrophosphohydrolase [Candidatus Melainabacteria bacterium]